MRFSIEPLTRYTRRALLSQIAKQYDPLGYCAPLFLKGRLILQESAMEGSSWDETINGCHIKAWNRWLETLDSWKDMSLQRWYFADQPTFMLKMRRTSCMHFLMRPMKLMDVWFMSKELQVTLLPPLLFSEKSRIVLRGQQNWPVARKELFAAVMAVVLKEKASNAMRSLRCKNYFWCDSKVVLQYICNPDLRMVKFVPGRINHILLHSRSDEWRHCPTEQNPADVATRPLNKSADSRLKLWLQGPEFISQPGDL